MATEVFNRYESKYLMDEHTYHRLEAGLLDRMDVDEHNRGRPFTTIGSVYYDTGDSSLIRLSLSKPLYKEKLRVRAYGVPGIQSTVYLEIKKKVRGKVNKRRTALELREAYDFVASGEKPALRDGMSRQVIDEIEYFLRLHDVSPSLYVAYDRRALFDRERRDLRITFDASIRTRRYDLRLELGDYGRPLLQEGQVLMEVKTAGNLPLWLAELLTEQGVRSRGFSKYGREYQRRLATRAERGEAPVYA